MSNHLFVGIVGLFDAPHDSSLERIAFLQQLVHAFRRGPNPSRQSLEIPRLNSGSRRRRLRSMPDESKPCAFSGARTFFDDGRLATAFFVAATFFGVGLGAAMFFVGTVFFRFAFFGVVFFFSAATFFRVQFLWRWLPCGGLF